MSYLFPLLLLLIILLGFFLFLCIRKIRDLKAEHEELLQKAKQQSEMQTALLKKQMDLSMLQEQINPHFLYNTLEAIRSQAEIADQAEIAAATETLGNYFRYCINCHGNPVHLFEELQNIQDYYQIIRFRFFDRIRLDIDIQDNTILQTYIPQLTLQPIVENAINHGLRDKITDGIVTIRAMRSDDIVYLTVSDNGCGLDERQIQELENRIGNPASLITDSQKRHGIALTNVHHRIQLLFGNTYGLHIQSVLGQGTDICITYPTDYNRIMKGQNERVNSAY